MSFLFGDSFDLYTLPADAIAGFWDSGATNFSLVAGRFGGRCLQNSSNGAYLVKSSGANDAVHHLTCAFLQTAALTGTTLGMYLQLSDGATNQCCIVFRSDGAILLTSATPGGTVLATYTGAVTLLAQWFAFEFEVVIHPTAGRFRVRKNGNTTDDFDSGATLNTRPGANSYANKLTLGQQTAVANQHIDDLLWRSDASSVPFVGDIRCYTRMPASDASVMFSRSPAGPIVQTPLTFNATLTPNSAFSYYTGFTASYDGTVSTGSASINAGYTGNLKCSVFNGTATTITTVLASATTLVNPTTGNNTITFPTPFPVTKGSVYWLGFASDTAGASALNTNNVAGRNSGTTGYSAFPAASPTTTTGTGVISSWTLAIINNAALVNEAQQDSTTSYVYSANVGDTDLYNIAPIGVTPASTVAVTTRAFVQKSDAGSRSGKVVLKSGGTTVDSGSAALSTTWQQMYRTDTLDPATGAAWTAVGVNSAQIGVSVAS
jgi:hypothetical protein